MEPTETTTTTTATTNSDGLTEIRNLIEEYLNGEEGSQPVQEYLTSLLEDETTLQIYLKGCRYRPKQAWRSLKRKAEVRFDEYPEVFPEAVPEIIYTLERRGTFGFLKTRDKLGRRLACVDGENWDTNEVSIEQLSAGGTHYMESALLDEDCMNNGTILVVNLGGLGLKHAKQLTIPALMRLLNVFWLAYPVKCKGVYGVNTPTFIRYLLKVIRPFFSKKLKERLVITGPDQKYKVLRENLQVPLELLPKFLGGVCENETAFDFEFLRPTK